MRLAVVVMGVSGSGKTSVADCLARRLRLSVVDADDLHSQSAVAKMRAGQPLTDVDRWPWLDRVGTALADTASAPAGVVMACSALQRAYRDRLRQACPGLRFVFLDGSEALIAERVRQRSGHYMPPSLLQSQFQALQRPSPEETDVLRVDVAYPLAEVVELAASVARTA